MKIVLTSFILFFTVNTFIDQNLSHASGGAQAMNKAAIDIQYPTPSPVSSGQASLREIPEEIVLNDSNMSRPPVPSVKLLTHHASSAMNCYWGRTTRSETTHPYPNTRKYAFLNATVRDPHPQLEASYDNAPASLCNIEKIVSCYQFTPDCGTAGSHTQTLSDEAKNLLIYPTQSPRTYGQINSVIVKLHKGDLDSGFLGAHAPYSSRFDLKVRYELRFLTWQHYELLSRAFLADFEGWQGWFLIERMRPEGFGRELERVSGEILTRIVDKMRIVLAENNQIPNDERLSIESLKRKVEYTRHCFSSPGFDFDQIPRVVTEEILNREECTPANSGPSLPNSQASLIGRADQNSRTTVSN